MCSQVYGKARLGDGWLSRWFVFECERVPMVKWDEMKEEKRADGGGNEGLFNSESKSTCGQAAASHFGPALP